MELTPETVAAYAQSWATRPDAEWFNRVKAVSMLHQETLALIELFASQCGGDALEIGAYVGGATLAMAAGIRRAGTGKVVTLDPFRPYLEHPQIPTPDSLADLRANLDAAGLADQVSIVRGFSVSWTARRRVGQLLQPESVGLFTIDADPYPSNNFWLYEPLLKDGCLLAMDDYLANGAPEKALAATRFVHAAVARGMFEPLAVVRWGTWFGRYRRLPEDQRRIARHEDAPFALPGQMVRRLKYALRQQRVARRLAAQGVEITPLRFRPPD